MIELGSRPVVVLEAAPFCFGPASTSLTVARALQRAGVAVVWMASGTTLDLIRRSDSEAYVVEFDLANKSHRQRWAYLLEEADAVLVNTDPEFAEFAVGMNSNVFYLDILYWMWDELPEVVERCVKYFYEDFFLSNQQEARLGLPGNAIRVRPLLDARVLAPTEKTETSKVLVSLGGLYQPGNRANALLKQYEDSILGLVRRLASASTTFRSIHVAGGRTPTKSEVLPNGVLMTTGSLDKSVYLQQLKSSTMCILSPGLTSFYEAAQHQKPTFYLPPHNYSQYLQLECFRDLVDESQIADWQSLGYPGTAPNYGPEPEMLLLVDEALRHIVNNPARLLTRLQAFWQGGYEQAAVAKSHDAVATLVDRNEVGAEEIAQIVKSSIPHTYDMRFMARSARKFETVPLPRKLTLELSGACQLKCPLCPTGQRRSGRAHGALSVHSAKIILDEIGGSLEEVDLFNWGEPFLNKSACQIIKLFASRGIRVRLSSNLQVIPEPEKLIESGLSELIVSCHGFTQEVYERYMVGGRVESTFLNLARILEAIPSESAMRVIVRYVVFNHNEHELELIRRFFRNTRVEVEAAPMRLDMREEILESTADNLRRDHSWVPTSSRMYDTDSLSATRAPLGCNLPFEEITIDVDGSVSMCCSSYDATEKVGNVLLGGIESIWNGASHQEARRIVTGEGETGAENVICRRCKDNGYRDF